MYRSTNSSAEEGGIIHLYAMSHPEVERYIVQLSMQEPCTIFRRIQLDLLSAANQPVLRGHIIDCPYPAINSVLESQ